VALDASDPVVRDVAERLLIDEQSALAAGLSAYLWACATRPGVLLSSVSILLAGSGARRAIDGRVRQPGCGLARPRGFLPEADIPAAARVAIPSNIPALFVAWAYGTGSSPGAALRAASTAARRSGSEVRAEILARAAARGGSAWVDSAVARELCRVAGAAQSGLVSSDDFAPAMDLDQPASVPLEFPWGAEDRAAGCSSEVVIAIDRKGEAVVVCYEVANEGLAVCGGELVCPLVAQPVLRGVPRVRPGTALPQRCSGRIEINPDTGQVVAVASGSLRLVAPR
jgi:gamma-glutamyltranspeptidase/glutathione hydrolase